MRSFLILAAASLTMAHAAGAQEPGASYAPIQSPIQIENAYSYATAPGQKNGAVFFTIKNDGFAPDRLLAVSTDASEGAELHQIVMEYDDMKMVRQDFIDVAQGQSIKLDPMGKHVMLIGLKKPLSAGASFSLNARFEKAGDLEIPVSIQPAGEAPAGDPGSAELHPEPKERE